MKLLITYKEKEMNEAIKQAKKEVRALESHLQTIIRNFTLHTGLNISGNIEVAPLCEIGNDTYVDYDVDVKIKF